MNFINWIKLGSLNFLFLIPINTPKMEHGKGDGADQIVVHKDYDDDSDYSNDCEDDNRMETDDDDARAGQIVVHGSQGGTSTEVTRTKFKPDNGQEYDASVEQILVEFRCQAHA